MAKLYVFGIGGTGSRVLRSLTMLLAAGVSIDQDRQNPITEIVPVIIDPDSQNGDLTRTVSLMNAYRKIRESLTFTKENGNKFFQTTVNRTLQNFTLVIKDTANKKFKDFIDYSMMSRENKAIVDMLFSEKNLESSMEVGFKGNPNIGSVVLNQVPMSADFDVLMNNFQSGDKIFIISSVFGGTGASGFPLLLKTLRTNKTMPNYAHINQAMIGAITILPYFGVKTDEGSEIESSTFISKASAAMAYYERNIVGNGDINALYYLADDQKNAYDNHEGMSDQKNDAHIIELLAATAIVHFCNDSAGGEQTCNYELGIKDDTEVITFNSFYEGLADMLRDSLTKFVLTANAFHDEFDFIRGHNLAANKKLGFDDDFYKGAFVRDIRHFLELYREWLTEMKGNKRSLNLFNLDCGKKPFTVVTDATERKFRNILKLLKSDYETFYGELNSVARKCRSEKKEDKLLEMFCLATENLIKHNFNF